MIEKIRAVMILEMAGRPSEYVIEKLKEHLKRMKELKDVRIICEKISEAKKMESEQEFYTCFAEVEVEVSSFSRLGELMFDFMPSSIEIIEPDEVKFDLLEATNFLNNLSGRLHRYDEIANIAQIQAQQLTQKFYEFKKKYEEEIKDKKDKEEGGSKKKIKKSSKKK